MASIVDYLKSKGQPSDFNSRKKLAEQYGIKGYSGTAAQNTQLLGLLQSGGAPASQPASNNPPPASPPASAPATAPQEFGFLDGSRYDSSGKQITPPQAALTAPVPKDVQFINSEAYKGLSEAEKEIVNMSFNLITLGGEEEARQFAEAIKKAKAIADPYFRSQLTLIQGELGSKIAELNNDFQTQAEIIQRTKDELLSDVASSKDFLTLEQQANLSKLSKEYDNDILKIRDTAAEKGITFASGYQSREHFENLRTETYQDVVESSNRKFNFQVQELTNRANRGEIDAAKKLEALTGKRTIALENLGRFAEAKIGSANVPSATGYSPVGGVVGELEENKRKAVLSDVGAFVNLQKGFL